jgi:hypothetical protein
MAEILDGIITIAWIWLYLIGILACLSGVLLIVAIFMHRQARDHFGRVRPIGDSEPKQSDKNRRSKLTADLL